MTIFVNADVYPSDAKAEKAKSKDKTVNNLSFEGLLV